MENSIWSGKRLGSLGGGNMAEALLRGVLDSGLLPPASVLVFDPLAERRQLFADMGCVAVPDATGLAPCDVVLLATKPQILPQALDSIAGQTRPETLYISIAAGIGSAAIASRLRGEARVVRVMPNTPLLVGLGMSALAKGEWATDNDMELALALFACAGKAVEVAEKELDAVTALSGSGPAYLFRFAEALIAGGVRLGLSPELSKELAIGMLHGSAEMLSRFGDPATLRQQVTSPGGTTAAALKVLDEGDFMLLVTDAMKAAAQRSLELGRQ